MNKKLKWTLITILAIALGAFGYYQLTPKENEELKAGHIALIGLAKNILETCIDILGFSAPEKM